MTEDTKQKALIFILLGAVLFILLAAALPRLELQRGIPIPARDTSGAPAEPEVQPSVTITINSFFVAAMAIIIILTLLITAYRVLRGTNLRDLLKQLLAVAVGTLLILGFMALLANVHVSFNPAVPETLPTEIPIISQPAGPVSFDFTWLAGIALACSVIGLGAWLALRQKQAPPALLVLQQNAERAVQEILAGMDLRSVIIECYLQMSQALQKERNIVLEETMTAREFEMRLDRQGLPPAPVHQLTRMFETARYSSLPPAAGDEQIALNCLTEIVAYCEQTRKPGAK